MEAVYCGASRQNQVLQTVLPKLQHKNFMAAFRGWQAAGSRIAHKKAALQSAVAALTESKLKAAVKFMETICCRACSYETDTGDSFG